MRVFVQRPRSVGSPALDYGFCTHYQRIDGSIKPVTAPTEGVKVGTLSRDSTPVGCGTICADTFFVAERTGLEEIS